MIKISVITVVFNDVAHIKETVESVIGQTYPNVEYIVVDGKSTDGTLEVLNSYSSEIDVFISEQDNGIYDAMNKGIDKATGEWVLFMNSNDRFHDNEVVSKFFVHSSGFNQVDVIYGDIVYSHNINEVIKPRSLNTIWKGLPFSHQAVFVRRELYKEFRFELRYKISSVHDFFYKLIENRIKFRYVNEIVAVYDLNGVSATSFRWVVENWLINLKYNPNMMRKVTFRLIYHFLLRFRNRYFKIHAN